jgi:hypothetical protein
MIAPIREFPMVDLSLMGVCGPDTASQPNRCGIFRALRAREGFEISCRDGLVLDPCNICGRPRYFLAIASLIMPMTAMKIAPPTPPPATGAQFVRQNPPKSRTGAPLISAESLQQLVSQIERQWRRAQGTEE